MMRLNQLSPSKNASKLLTSSHVETSSQLKVKKRSIIEAEYTMSDWKAKQLDRFVDAVAGAEYGGWEEQPRGINGRQAQNNNEDDVGEIIDQTGDDETNDDESP